MKLLLSNAKELIVIVGPTAIGKTALSIQLAKKWGTEIISADSRQFYQEMEIGTAKPSLEEMDGVVHHFVGNISIHDDYNAGQYERDAIEKLTSLFEIHNRVIMVGGSGLYVDAVCKGFDAVPPKDEDIRQKLEHQLESEGIAKLQEQLLELDPQHYQATDLNNGQRLVRALEVCISSGKPFSSFRQNTPKKRNFRITKVGLNTHRDVLYDRINRRVDVMMDSGLVDEVKGLLPYRHLNALQTVGYKELFDFFDRNCTLDEAVDNIKQNTRRFAKRQLTWFRRDERTRWFDMNGIDRVEAELNATS